MGAFELVTRLESLRKKIRTRNAIFTSLVVVGIIGFYLYPFIAMPLIVIVTIAGAFTGRKMDREFDSLYKTHFVSAMLGEFFENPSYVWDRGFSEEVVRSFGLSQMGNRFSSEDYISGTYKGVSFEQSDVRIQYHTSGKNSHTTTYFEGRMFVFQFDKHSMLPVQVFSEGFMYRAKPAAGFKMSKVTLESVEFNKRFDVKAVNEHDAFYVLTPHMMEKIIELQERFGYVAFNFSDNRLFVGFKCGMGAFDADMSKPISYPAERAKIQKDMQVIMDIIDIMNLDQ